MKTAIQVDKLSKQYGLGQVQPYISLRDVVVSAIKPSKQTASKKNQFWALKDISFKIKKGEVIGVIGRNGAGKSTLLKILSRITSPTNGQAIIKGRVASLLEVGTGFHQELTGKENIFLNGAVLGMTKKEIQQKFQAIIKFSGIQKFLDTPVKHYSTGMRLRLAFAIAAHLEPEILLIDEVLAVGDVEFQKKCLKKMDQISDQVGRTILFVSHDMASIARLCNRCIWLEKGKVKKIGKAEEVVSQYLKHFAGEEYSKATRNFPDQPSKDSKILSVAVKNHLGKISSLLDIAKPFFIEIKVRSKYGKTNMFLAITSDFHKQYIFQTYLGDGSNKKIILKKGVNLIKVKIEPLLNEGIYGLKIATSDGGVSSDKIPNILYFNIINNTGLPHKTMVKKHPNSLVVHKTKWSLI